MNEPDFPWAAETFTGVPRRHPAPGFRENGVKALFYDGPEWRGRPTRVFAWYGRPAGASARKPVPGIVLVHGGGATALADWVRLWNARGFAAIAMDTCGGIPAWSACPYYRTEWPRHRHSGPAGWGKMQESALPPHEQWMFHAVGAALNGHSLLASFPEVDAARIGITGISWGGVITCIAAGVDPRLRFAVPVYGCGFFNDPDSSLFAGTTAESRDRWFKLWDPGHFLPHAAMPFLWCTGAEDPAFPLPAWQRSAASTAGPSLCSLRIDYPHNHTECWNSRTIDDFVRAVLDQRPLPDWETPELSGGRLSARVNTAGRTVSRAELCFTRATGSWQDRRWRTVPLTPDAAELSAELPPQTCAAFFRLHGSAGENWSSTLYQTL